jgi:hypothetical protein
MNSSVRLSSSDPLAVLSSVPLPIDYIFTAADKGVHTFSPITLYRAGTQSLSASDTVTAGLAGTQGGILVNPAFASHFVITGPSGVTAGTLFSITVTALDNYGNVATGYTGTVYFKSSDGTATLPAKYTFTAADQGVHTFTGLKLKKKGTQTITVIDTLNSTITGSLFVSVV